MFTNNRPYYNHIHVNRLIKKKIKVIKLNYARGKLNIKNN